MRTAPPDLPARIYSQPRRQRGVVLIVALIVLVAMSLGGIAILRSVDTSTLIAGNIAFKQSTLQGADVGLESAVKWISDNRANLSNDNASAGYYSSTSRAGTDRFKWEQSASWSNAKYVGTDSAGNQVHYVIHRLCKLPGISFGAVEQTCATNMGSGAGGSYDTPSEGMSNVGDASQFTSAPKLYLRVTARSLGPRNAVSYVQAMVLVPTAN